MISIYNYDIAKIHNETFNKAQHTQNKIYFTSSNKSPSYQYMECTLRKNYKYREINLGIFMCKKIFSFHAESLEKTNALSSYTLKYLTIYLT